MKKSSRIITASLGIICIILSATLTGTIIQYNSTIEDKELTIDNLQHQIEEKNNTISSLNLQLTNKDSQIENITNAKDQIQVWLNNNITAFNNETEEKNNTISILNRQITNKDSQIENITNAKDQIQVWLNNNITAFDNQITKLESILTFNTSDLQTLAFHIVGEKEDWINNTDINSIYNELLAYSNNTYEIIIFPEVREHQNFTATLEWLNNDFMGKEGIPIMLEVFSGSEENLSITKLSLENITTALAKNNIKYLRIAEVISYYMEHIELFPEDYLIDLFELCRENDLKIFWTEWKIDYLSEEVEVFTYIEKLIEGYEDIVTVSFSTNSGEAEPAVGFYNLDEMFQHWGASIQAWYWDTRYDEDLQNMSRSLLALHASVAKSAGAEIIQFEPYWYFFNSETGEITENLELLFEMLK